MFKDAYKAANDDITPDPYLLSRILNKSEEKQKPVFYHFRFAPVAAIIALALVLPGLIHNPAGTGTQVLENDSGPQVASTPGTYYIMPENKAADTPQNSPKTSAYDTAGTTAAKDETDFSSVNTAVDMTVVMSVNNVVPTAELAAYTRTSGGASTEPTVKEQTASQYFEALGFSTDMLAIPNGLVADFDAESTVNVTKLDGEILSDENTFTFSGENYLFVTTSSKPEDVLLYLENPEYEKSVFGDKNAVVLYDGSVYQAYVIHSSGTALKIVTDMPEEDLKNLLISAAR